MNRQAFGVLAAFAMPTPASAASWGTDYQMGTLVAYGGSDADGHISLECGDPAAQGLAAGVPEGEMDRDSRQALLALLQSGEVLSIPGGDAEAMVVAGVCTEGAAQALDGFNACAQSAN